MNAPMKPTAVIQMTLVPMIPVLMECTCNNGYQNGPNCSNIGKCGTVLVSTITVQYRPVEGNTDNSVCRNIAECVTQIDTCDNKHKLHKYPWRSCMYLSPRLRRPWTATYVNAIRAMTMIRTLALIKISAKANEHVVQRGMCQQMSMQQRLRQQQRTS